jgi:protein required for attachment to host cells
MEATWIVAANSGRARFFNAGTLEEIHDMVSPTAREREQDIVTDDIGQRSASKSRHNVGQPTTPSGYQPNRTPSQIEADRFARDVSEFLVKAHNEGRFRKLNLVASPEFLGILRKQVEPLASVVSVEINKDYTNATAAELKQRIQDHTALK